MARRGRPSTNASESRVALTAPAWLRAAVEERARQEGVSAATVWRRGALVYLGRPVLPRTVPLDGPRTAT